MLKILIIFAAIIAFANQRIGSVDGKESYRIKILKGRRKDGFIGTLGNLLLILAGIGDLLVCAPAHTRDGDGVLEAARRKDIRRDTQIIITIVLRLARNLDLRVKRNIPWNCQRESRVGLCRGDVSIE